MAHHLNNFYDHISGYFPFQIVNENNANYQESKEEIQFNLPNGTIVRDTRTTIRENDTRRVIHDRTIGHRTYREVIRYNDNEQQQITRYTRGFNPDQNDINQFIGDFEQYMNNYRNNNVNNNVNNNWTAMQV
jgi:hypothetical protein